MQNKSTTTSSLVGLLVLESGANQGPWCPHALRALIRFDLRMWVLFQSTGIFFFHSSVLTSLAWIQMLETIFVLTASLIVSWENKEIIACHVWCDVTWHGMCKCVCVCVAEWIKHQLALSRWVTVMCRLTAYKTMWWASERKRTGHCFLKDDLKPFITNQSASRHLWVLLIEESGEPSSVQYFATYVNFCAVTWVELLMKSRSWWLSDMLKVHYATFFTGL